MAKYQAGMMSDLIAQQPKLRPFFRRIFPHQNVKGDSVFRVRITDELKNNHIASTVYKLLSSRPEISMRLPHFATSLPMLCGTQ
jgi:hypothetical protein